METDDDGFHVCWICGTGHAGAGHGFHCRGCLKAATHYCHVVCHGHRFVIYHNVKLHSFQLALIAFAFSLF